MKKDGGGTKNRLVDLPVNVSKLVPARLSWPYGNYFNQQRQTVLENKKFQDVSVQVTFHNKVNS